MPIEPTDVRVESISTSSENTSPSGVSTSTGNFEWAIRRPRPLGDQAGQGRRERGVPIVDRRDRRSASTRATEDAEMRRSSSGLDDLVDGALEEERALGHLVVLAFDDLLEAAD